MGRGVASIPLNGGRLVKRAPKLKLRKPLSGARFNDPMAFSLIEARITGVVSGRSPLAMVKST